MIHAGFFFLLALSACKSSPINPSCEGGKDLTCPLGSQKECSTTEEPCSCRCRGLNKDPYAPNQIDQNSKKPARLEKPASQELDNPNH
jgi:hypothetical protein